VLGSQTERRWEEASEIIRDRFNRRPVAVDLTQPCNQTEFADLVGVSQQAVSDAMQRGMLGKGQTRAPGCARTRRTCASRPRAAAPMASSRRIARR
jgi:hypothetical protein